MKKRRKHIRWAYNGDGRFPERRNRWYKTYWNRWIRRNQKREDREQSLVAQSGEKT